MPTGGVDVLVAAGLSDAAASAVAGVVGTALESGAIGAGVGGLVGGVEDGGKGILKGAEAGGITGLGVGAGGAIGGAAIGGAGIGGISGTTIGDIAGGAIGGGLGGAVTGGNIGTSALEGAGSGLLSSQLSTTPTTSGAPSTTSAAAQGGGAGSAAGSAAPVGAGVSPGGDVTLTAADNQFLSNAGANTGQSLQNVASQTGVQPTGGIASDSDSLSPAGSTTSINTASAAPVSETPSGSSASLATNNSAPVSSNVGTGTTGTQSIANSPTDSLVKGFAADQAAAAPVTDALSPSVINASNAASPGGVDPSLNQPSTLSNLTGSTSPVAQGDSAASDASSPGFLSGAINSLQRNALPLAISGGGVVMDAIKNQQTIKGENQIKQIAGQEQAQGSLLQNYLTTGTLPPGLQAGLDQASKAAEASIRSSYAARGMSGSSAEQQDLQNLSETVQGQGAQMALQLLQTGINETGMASSLYNSIINETLGKDQQLGSAISSFASAAAGGSGAGGKFQIVQSTGG
jgi:hypothetical protein